MRNLLIVTDHRFYEFKGDIYDNYVFDYFFFKDYMTVFDRVTIVARVSKLTEPPVGYLKTTGENLSFVNVKDVRGVKWVLYNRFFLKQTKLDISEFDAICYRIPSVLSFSVWSAALKYDIPHMFEMIGHPTESLQFGGSKIKRLFLAIIGRTMHKSSKKIVKTATCGSYVTFKSLQEEYPTNEQAQWESISSIRLEDRFILKKLSPVNLESLSIVHLGSFVPIKNQEFLIDFLLKIKEFYTVELTFIGDGGLLKDLKEKVKSLGLENMVKFRGHVVGFENIVNELDKNNIFILPSFSEGMPRAMIEAMARGLICFGSNRGGIAELISEEYLFDPSDLTSLVNKFDNIMANVEKIESDRIKNLELTKSFEKNILTQKRIKLLNLLKESSYE